MPLYEYECDSCGLRFEMIRRFSDPPVETCKNCGGPVHKLFSAPAIRFKGTGWYVTDYGRNKGAESATTPPAHASSEKSDKNGKSKTDAGESASSSTSSSTTSDAGSSSTSSSSSSSDKKD